VKIKYSSEMAEISSLIASVAESAVDNDFDDFLPLFSR